MSKAMMDCNCHTQGVGWCAKTNQVVVTCQGADGFSYLVLFPDYSESSKPEAIDIIKNDANGRNFSHPSAIQIYNGLMPVAIAKEKRDSSFIYFYNLLENKIVAADILTLKYHKHIGALGLTKLNDKLILLGMGWGADYFAIWEFDSHNFKLVKEGALSEITDDLIGAYNSIWMGTTETGENILIASCGSFYSKKKNYLDIFKITDKNGELFLKKKDRIYVNEKTKGTIKSLFFEGVTIRELKKDTIKIISTPQDFRKESYDTRLRNLYEGYLIVQPIKKMYPQIPIRH